MDNSVRTTLPAADVTRGGELCVPGTAWTCTIQCRGGTRYAIERIYGQPGVEACVIGYCECQPVAPAAASYLANPPQDVLDPTLPIALVIFGAVNLLRAP